MKYILTLLLSTIIFATSFSQQKKDSAIKRQSKTEREISADSLNGRATIDVLKVQLLPTKNDADKNDKPWQIALVVGVLTFIATIIVSLINRHITLKSIQTNKEIAIQQIENSQNATLHQFNSTLKTKNRQDWINDVRNSLSEFIANCVKSNVEFQDPTSESKQKIKDIHENIILNRTKLRLLLNSNPDKTLHNNLHTSIKEFVDIFDKHVLNYRNNINDYNNYDFQKACDKIVDDGRALLYDEWQKIQKLTNDKDTKQ